MKLTPVVLLKQNVLIRDITTNVEGQIRGISIDAKRECIYNFKPRGLHPKLKQPLGAYGTLRSHFADDAPVETYNLPMEILHTEATDKLSGFSGKITNLNIHPNGCLHVTLQPQGVDPETGTKFDSREFALADIIGPAITDLKVEEPEVASRPSPDNELIRII